MMEDRMPKPGDFYRHFKGKIYQVKMLAKDSETGELQVVYQAMYPPFGYWVRPLEMFLGKVDRSKYPDIAEQNRFEKLTPEAIMEKYSMQQPADSAVDTVRKTVSNDTLVRALHSGRQAHYLGEDMTEEEIAEIGYMRLLDAGTYHEKRQLLIGLRQYLDKRLLHNIAASLDVVLEEGDLESQYDSLLHCLDTMEHFEGGRLR